MMILNLSKSLAKPLVMAKLNMAYLSSLKTEQNCCCPHCRKNRAKLLLSSLPVSPSRVLRAPSTSLYHYRAKLLLSSLPVSTEQNCCCPHCRCHHLGYSVLPAHHCTIWCRSTFGPRGPGLSNPTSFLRACSPNGTDNRQQRQRQTERPPPEPSDILKRFHAL